MLHRNRLYAVFLIAALLLSACQPIVAQPVAQQAESEAMAVVDEFFAAWNNADKERMMALLTDDVVWSWLDSAKNFPVFLPEGRYGGEGKEEVGAMFDNNPIQWGYAGYPVWTEVRGDKVFTTEVWQSAYERETGIPLIVRATYTVRDGKLAEWVWDCSRISSDLTTFTPNTLEVNRQLMASINDEIWNQGKLELIDERYAEDYVRHEPGYPPELQGSAGLKQFIQAVRGGFPDWNCAIEEMLAVGDKVVVRYRCSGTHTGEWNGIPATGNRFEFTDTIIHRIADGKVVEDWSEYDSLGWMQQLGFQLTPPQATSGGVQPNVLVTGAHIRSPNGIKVGPDGKLYVASTNERAVLVVDPDTGEILKRYGHEAGVRGPDDVAVAPDGSIYWTDIFEGRVGRLGADGSMRSQMVDVGVNPIVFSSDGRLFAALAFLGDALYELDPNLIEPPRLLAENLGGLNSFQFGPDGKLYAPLMDKGQVVRIDVDAEPIEIEVVAEGLWPVAVKLDSKGQLYANGDPNANPTGITRIDIATGELETVAVTPSGSDNFAFDANDRLFATLLAEGTITEVMDDGSLRMLGPVGMVSPGGVTIRQRADGESIFVADLWMLQEFDSATGEFLGKVDNLMPNTVVVDGDNLLITSWFGNAVFVWNSDAKELVEEYYDFNMPMNTIRFQGDLIVAELGTGSVVRASGADPAQRTTIADGFVKPMGLAADDENLWVSDRDTGKVWQIIADGEAMDEPLLVTQGLYRPEGMALAPDGRLLVAETGTDRLLAIDLATSAQSTIAQDLGFSPIYPDGMIPWGMMSGIAVSPSGTIYVTADEANVVYRIDPDQ